jgi:hypothetical protein
METNGAIEGMTEALVGLKEDSLVAVTVEVEVEVEVVVVKDVIVVVSSTMMSQRMYMGSVWGQALFLDADW